MLLGVVLDMQGENWQPVGVRGGLWGMISWRSCCWEPGRRDRGGKWFLSRVSHLGNPLSYHGALRSAPQTISFAPKLHPISWQHFPFASVWLGNVGQEGPSYET